MNNMQILKELWALSDLDNKYSLWKKKKKNIRYKKIDVIPSPTPHTYSLPGQKLRIFTHGYGYGRGTNYYAETKNNFQKVQCIFSYQVISNHWSPQP